MLIDNFRIISQVEWRKQDSQIKMFSKPKCENGKEYSRITRPNDARSQVRCGHDVNNRYKLIVDWLKLAELYKPVAEWLCVNTRYGTFATAIYLLRRYKKQSKITELKREDGTSETDILAMTKMLNEFFVNIASGLCANSTLSELDTSVLENFVSSKLTNFDTQFNIPFSYPEPFLRAVNRARRGALAKSISNWLLIGHNETMVYCKYE